MKNPFSIAIRIWKPSKRVIGPSHNLFFGSMLPILGCCLSLIVSCSNPQLEQPVPRFVSFNYSEGRNHADGEWYFFSNFGQLYGVGSFKNNHRFGLWKAFHLEPSGIVYSIGEYRDYEEDWFDPPFQSATNQDSLPTQTDKIVDVEEAGFDPFDASQAAFIAGLLNGEMVSADGLWVYFDLRGNKLYEVMYDEGRELWRR